MHALTGLIKVGGEGWIALVVLAVIAALIGELFLPPPR